MSVLLIPPLAGAPAIVPRGYFHLVIAQAGRPIGSAFGMLQAARRSTASPVVGLIRHELLLYQRKCKNAAQTGAGRRFCSGSANGAAEGDALLTGLYPLVKIDHRVALVLDIVRQLRGAFQDVGGVIGLTHHEPALGIDPTHELKDRHLGLPLRVQLVCALRVGLGLLAADTRTNAPLQHVLHYIDFLSP